MIALFRLMALLTDQAKPQGTTSKNFALGAKNSSCHEARAVVVFSHHRDLKVAIDELHEAGFSHNWITLITRNTKYCSWCPEFITKNYFDPEQFNFSQVAQNFFLQLFHRGKYLVILSGNGHEVNAASKIMSRRQKHASIWRFD